MTLVSYHNQANGKAAPIVITMTFTAAQMGGTVRLVSPAVANLTVDDANYCTSVQKNTENIVGGFSFISTSPLKQKTKNKKQKKRKKLTKQPNSCEFAFSVFVAATYERDASKLR